MAWARVTLVVPGSEAQVVSDALETAGAICVDLSDADAGTPAEREVLVEVNDHAALWARCRVTALFPADADAVRRVDEAIADCAGSALGAAARDRKSVVEGK